MEILFIIIWLLIGIIAVWRMYHYNLKDWYNDFKESYWDFDKREGSSSIRFLLYMSPLLIVGGLATLIISEIMHGGCWYFTTKDK